jgi:hypothetical protein
VDQQKIVGAFDVGYEWSRKYVHVNDDTFCDYCRVVGSGVDFRLLCTLGTANGLVGESLVSGVIDAGYPDSIEWIDRDGVPVFSRAVGDSRALTALTPVTARGIGDTTYRPR